MANNRLWAVCKYDNEAACLGKSYGLWGGLRSPDDFFKEHENCPGNKGGGENIAWCDEDDDRVIQYDFRYYDNNNKIYIYFKGDEEKPRYKKDFSTPPKESI